MPVIVSDPHLHSSFVPVLLSSAIAGLLEPFLFHPFDTISKRLMVHGERLVSWKDVKQVVWRRTVYDGFGFAMIFKIFQRIYKFGGQPIANDIVWNWIGPGWTKKYGKENSKPFVNAITGALIGAGEVILTPIDILKIKMQTNPDSLRGKSILKLVRADLSSFYAGFGWTIVRNVPGTFVLFGGNAWIKENIFLLDDYKSASFFQNTCSSAGAAILSIIVSAPLDVIKTRIQKGDFNAKKVSGFQIARHMFFVEGISSFFKGLIPKLFMVAPKLIFSFTVAQSLVPVFEKII